MVAVIAASLRAVSTRWAAANASRGEAARAAPGASKIGEQAERQGQRSGVEIAGAAGIRRSTELPLMKTRPG